MKGNIESFEGVLRNKAENFVRGVLKMTITKNREAYYCAIEAYKAGFRRGETEERNRNNKDVI